LKADTRSLLMASAIAPLAVVPASFCQAMVAFVFGVFPGDQTMSAALSIVFAMSFFGVPIAYLCMVLVGLPAAAIALRAGYPRLWVAVPFGVVVAELVGAPFQVGQWNLVAPWWMAMYGAAVSALFTVVFRARRPQSELAERSATAE
jgi:hypothetical protein